MKFEMCTVCVMSKHVLTADYINSGTITGIDKYKIIIQSDGGYELEVTPRDELTGRHGVWKTSCNPDELIGKHVAYIGTHGLRLDDNTVIRPYIERINIRAAFGLDD